MVRFSSRHGVRGRAISAVLSALVACSLGVAPAAAATQTEIPPEAAAVSAQTIATSRTCGAMEVHVEMVAPPNPLKASVVRATLTDDCVLQIDGPVVEEIADLGVAPVSNSAGPTPLATTKSATRRAISRSWDCCGIKMTEQTLYMKYWWNSIEIVDVYVDLSESHHLEADGRGWFVESWSLRRTNGCIGCETISYRGIVDWGYRGVFDGSGTRFHNQHVNNITANGRTGASSCSMTITWRDSIAGWKKEFICTT